MAWAQKTKVIWLSQSEEHDYPAAMSYLSLLHDGKKGCHVCPSIKTGLHLQV